MQVVLWVLYKSNWKISGQIFKDFYCQKNPYSFLKFKFFYYDLFMLVIMAFE